MLNKLLSIVIFVFAAGLGFGLGYAVAPKAKVTPQSQLAQELHNNPIAQEINALKPGQSLVIEQRDIQKGMEFKYQGPVTDSKNLTEAFRGVSPFGLSPGETVSRANGNFGIIDGIIQWFKDSFWTIVLIGGIIVAIMIACPILALAFPALAPFFAAAGTVIKGIFASLAGPIGVIWGYIKGHTTGSSQAQTANDSGNAAFDAAFKAAINADTTLGLNPTQKAGIINMYDKVTVS